MTSRIRIAYGLCSYSVALALLLIPIHITEGSNGITGKVALAAGLFLFFVSIVTDFELGVLRLLRFRENAWLMMTASLTLALIVMLLGEGWLTWLVVMLAGVQFSMATTAFRTVFFNRENT